MREDLTGDDGLDDTVSESDDAEEADIDDTSDDDDDDEYDDSEDDDEEDSEDESDDETPSFKQSANSVEPSLEAINRILRLMTPSVSI